jgi:hypothetical protein
VSAEKDRFHGFSEFSLHALSRCAILRFSSKNVPGAVRELLSCDSCDSELCGCATL